MTFDLQILLTSLLATIVVFAIFWAVHIRLKDAGIVDIYWGPGFFIIGLLTMVMAGDITLHKLILLVCTIAWAMRLGWHIATRHQRSTNEDRRYALMRQNSGPSFWWHSFFKIFLLQAVLMWLIASPLHTGLMSEDPIPGWSFQALFYSGMILFGSGLIFETIADYQLARFRSKPTNDGQTMTTGLWAYSRHPNYFGEVVLWWGFGLMAFALSHSALAFIGPALLTFLILKISGVSLLEKHLAPEKKGYDTYIKTTNAFIPSFKKR